jgi:hypothetical protein
MTGFGAGGRCSDEWDGCLRDRVLSDMYESEIREFGEEGE